MVILAVQEGVRISTHSSSVRRQETQTVQRERDRRKMNPFECFSGKKSVQLLKNHFLRKLPLKRNKTYLKGLRCSVARFEAHKQVEGGTKQNNQEG